jgi:hypothetical protein
LENGGFLFAGDRWSPLQHYDTKIMGLVVLNQALFIALFNSCVTAFAENRTTAAIADKMIRANRATAQTAAKAFSDAAFA